jgi:hypothetical protein
VGWGWVGYYLLFKENIIKRPEKIAIRNEITEFIENQKLQSLQLMTTWYSSKHFTVEFE